MAPDPDWPSVAYEERSWTPTTEIPRRWRTTYAGPYLAAVVPTIESVVVDTPSAVAALADEAATMLAAFDAELGVELVPYGAILLRSESASSSRIERLTASARSVALAELGDRSRRNATEIAANTAAMRAALRLADRVDEAAILDTQRTLLDDVQPDAVGWRDQQVWIGASSYGPHTAAFVPPHHERVRPAVADLVAFVERDDLPVVVQAAIAHAQFETIHPFTDGNGRTGRALLHAIFRAKGLTRHVAVPVSSGLLVDVDRYFDALDAYRNGEPGPIIERVSEAIHAAVVNGRALVESVRSIRQRWSDVLVARPQATVWRALDVIVRQPVLDSALLQRAIDVRAQAADDAIGRLVDIGALEQVTVGRRNRKYAAPEILAALDDFADRGGRRTPPT